MTTISVDTDAIRSEASKWVGLSDDMARIRGGAQGLWLGQTAFFIGNLTEFVHFPAYRDFQSRMVSRLEGAEVEFELVGTALRRIADSYDDGEALTKRTLDEMYSVTPADVNRATGGPSGSGNHDGEAGGVHGSPHRPV